MTREMISGSSYGPAEVHAMLEVYDELKQRLPIATQADRVRLAAAILQLVADGVEGKEQLAGKVEQYLRTEQFRPT